MSGVIISCTLKGFFPLITISREYAIQKRSFEEVELTMRLCVWV